MPDRSRIPPKPSDYSTYMQRTDKRQLSIDPATGNPRWMTWKWTATESEQWTKFRQRCDELYLHYSDKKSRNTNVKDKMHALIKETRSYDSGRGNGHKLLLKIKVTGTIDDFQTFRIKEGTPLQKKPVRSSDEPGSLTPLISIREIKPGVHVLSIRNSDAPNSRALPGRIKFAYVYRYIGTNTPKNVREYVYVGVAKRGIYRSKLPDEVRNSDKKYFAWYIAQYMSKRGKLGNVSVPQRAPVI